MCRHLFDRRHVWYHADTQFLAFSSATFCSMLSVDPVTGEFCFELVRPCNFVLELRKPICRPRDHKVVTVCRPLGSMSPKTKQILRAESQLIFSAFEMLLAITRPNSFFLCCARGRGAAAHRTDRHTKRVDHKQLSESQSKRPRPASTAFSCPDPEVLLAA